MKKPIRLVIVIIAVVGLTIGMAGAVFADGEAGATAFANDGMGSLGTNTWVDPWGTTQSGARAQADLPWWGWQSVSVSTLGPPPPYVEALAFAFGGPNFGHSIADSYSSAEDGEAYSYTDAWANNYSLSRATADAVDLLIIPGSGVASAASYAYSDVNSETRSDADATSVDGRATAIAYGDSWNGSYAQPTATAVETSGGTVTSNATTYAGDGSYASATADGNAVEGTVLSTALAEAYYGSYSDAVSVANQFGTNPSTVVDANAYSYSEYGGSAETCAIANAQDSTAIADADAIGDWSPNFFTDLGGYAVGDAYALTDTGTAIADTDANGQNQGLAEGNTLALSCDGYSTATVWSYANLYGGSDATSIAIEGPGLLAGSANGFSASTSDYWGHAVSTSISIADNGALATSASAADASTTPIPVAMPTGGMLTALAPGGVAVAYGYVDPTTDVAYSFTLSVALAPGMTSIASATTETGNYGSNMPGSTLIAVVIP